MLVGKERIVNKAFAEKGLENIIKWDVQKIKNGQNIKVKFISDNSSYKHGIWMKTDIGIEIPDVSNEVFSSITLWEDTAPNEVICKCYSSDGFLNIYNIWDEGEGMRSQSYSSGMQIELHNNISIYHCNDYGFDADFNDLVFSIEKL